MSDSAFGERLEPATAVVTCCSCGKLWPRDARRFNHELQRCLNLAACTRRALGMTAGKREARRLGASERRHGIDRAP